LFLIIFYTDVLGIPVVIAGLIAMASRIFDGANDILIGYISDKTGNYKKWILWGAVFTAISFVFMFTNFNLSPTMQIVFAIGTFCIWTLLYTCYAIPFNAFASTMTQDTIERTKLNSYRFAIVAIPSLLIALATPFLKDSQLMNQSTINKHPNIDSAGVLLLIGFT
jgi:GPH family glycoside/pentoside/hexuronide:cation symporter